MYCFVVSVYFVKKLLNMYFTHRKSQYGEPLPLPCHTHLPLPSPLTVGILSLLYTDLKLQTLSEEKRRVVS